MEIQDSAGNKLDKEIHPILGDVSEAREEDELKEKSRFNRFSDLGREVPEKHKEVTDSGQTNEVKEKSFVDDKNSVEIKSRDDVLNGIWKPVKN